MIVGYMLYLGASPTELGLIASVPLLAQLVSPFAAYFRGLAGRLKGLTVVTALFGRALWLLATFLPLLGVPKSLRPTFIVGMTANLGAGWLLDRVSAPSDFQLVLGIGVVSALLGVVLLLFHAEPRTVQPRPNLRAVFEKPWQNPNFRKFLVFGVHWQASVLVAAPFVFTYFIDRLKMSFTKIAVWSIVASVTAFFSTSLWGRVADRYGNKVVIALGTAFAESTMPLSWMLASETNLWPIWLSAVFDALAWGAVGPAVFNLALAAAPKEERTAFVAMYSFSTGAAGFVGGLLSGPLLVLSSRSEPSMGGFT